MNLVTIDWKNADILFGRLVHAVRTRSFPFNEVEVPQIRKNIPDSIVWGSYEHALFLFAVCYYMRGGIKSKTAILAMGEMYERFTHLFTPWIGFEEKEIRSALAECGLNYGSEEVARFWKINSAKLATHWNADPRTLFADSPSYDVLCGRIIRKGKKSEHSQYGFYGFREKMVSMLVYFYMHAGIIPQNTFPLPVDFHLQRLMVSHEVLHVEGFGIGDNYYSPMLLAAGRQATHEWCAKNAINSLDLADALWLLSSELCNQHPGNRSVGGRNRNGRSTVLEPFNFEWNETHQNAFDRTCRQCPVQDTCQFQIPAAYYYIQGKLLVRSKRQQPQQLAWRFD
jgi:hypothetical protein